MTATVVSPPPVPSSPAGHPAPSPPHRGVRFTPTRSGSPPLVGSAVLALLGLVGGMVAGRPDVAAFGAAFAVLAAAAAMLAETPVLHVRVEVRDEQVLEGDAATVTAVVGSDVAVDRLDVALVVPAGLTVVEGSPAALRLRAGEEQTLDVVVRADRWGLHRVGTFALRARDRTGLLRWEASIDDPHAVKVLPGPAELDALVRPARTRVHAGNQVSRAQGEGSEFADIRPFLPGDQARDVNWRLTARRGEPWVNLRHPERSTDVVLFLDTFAEVGLADGVRAAAALATAHLDEQDRVGLVGFGGSLRWIEPAGGRRQQYRLVDALIGSKVYESEAWRSLRAVPQRCLPPNALVLAVSPLADQRVVDALGDLRSRGIDVAVLEVVPIQEPTSGSTFGPLAERLWRLERRAVRSRFARLGTPVATWDGEGPLAPSIEEIMAFRRGARGGR